MNFFYSEALSGTQENENLKCKYKIMMRLNVAQVELS